MTAVFRPSFIIGAKFGITFHFCDNFLNSRAYFPAFSFLLSKAILALKLRKLSTFSLSDVLVITAECTFSERKILCKQFLLFACSPRQII